MASHDVAIFYIGEEINPEEWGLRVKVAAVYPETQRIDLEVIKGGQWAYVGRVISMEPIENVSNSWRIDHTIDLPWYILYSFEGRKRFEHYR